MSSEPDEVECDVCHGDGEIHDADFSDGDSDQQMFLMQDTLRQWPVTILFDEEKAVKS